MGCSLYIELGWAIHILVLYDELRWWRTGAQQHATLSDGVHVEEDGLNRRKTMQIRINEASYTANSVTVRGEMLTIQMPRGDWTLKR